MEKKGKEKKCWLYQRECKIVIQFNFYITKGTKDLLHLKNDITLLLVYNILIYQYLKN